MALNLLHRRQAAVHTQLNNSLPCPLHRPVKAISSSKPVFRSPHHQHHTCKGARLVLAAKRGLEATAEKVPEGRLENDESPDVLEPGAPDLPRPSEFQQTLMRSFTLGGIGLHSGEYAYVRVRPAFAGEGRYFVRVPPGTNDDRFKLEGLEELPESTQAPVDPETEQLKVQLFRAYLEAQDEGDFSGSFEEWVDAQQAGQVLAVDQAKTGADDDDDEGDEGEEGSKATEEEEQAEPIQGRDGEEDAISASWMNLIQPNNVHTTLGTKDNYVMSAELLLSALEACGVDNARIEIEGGNEIPILDGSALGWVMEIQFAGLRLAPSPDGEATVGKQVLRPETVITVRGSAETANPDAFISLYPEDAFRFTAGIDYDDVAPVIGKQWMSYAPLQDIHYRFELAGARMCIASPDHVLELRRMGLVQGGSEACMLIGFGNRWYDPELVRFYRDEPVRHALVQLIGHLALNNRNGNSGVPVGHVVAYKADHLLMAKFLEELQAATSEEDWAPFWIIAGSTGVNVETDDAEGEDGEAEEAQLAEDFDDYEDEGEEEEGEEEAEEQ